MLAVSSANAFNPLDVIGETYSQWKERLFGSGHPTPDVVDAPASGPIAMQPGHPLRLQIAVDAPERDFSKGKSRYREIELPDELEHAVVRVQVVAEPNSKGRGNAVFKPLLYVFGEGEEVRDPVEAKPLHLDMRPFRRTRLLGCVTLDKVQHFAVATGARYARQVLRERSARSGQRADVGRVLLRHRLGQGKVAVCRYRHADSRGQRRACGRKRLLERNPRYQCVVPPVTRRSCFVESAHSSARARRRSSFPTPCSAGQCDVRPAAAATARA